MGFRVVSCGLVVEHLSGSSNQGQVPKRSISANPGSSKPCGKEGGGGGGGLGPPPGSATVCIFSFESPMSMT